jgi:hypothetical protein
MRDYTQEELIKRADEIFELVKDKQDDYNRAIRTDMSTLCLVNLALNYMPYQGDFVMGTRSRWLRVGNARVNAREGISAGSLDIVPTDIKPTHSNDELADLIANDTFVCFYDNTDWTGIEMRVFTRKSVTDERWNAMLVRMRYNDK